MKRPRRTFWHLAAATVALSAVSWSARAQIYPTRPMTMVIPFAAGGAQDVLGRLMAQRMGEILGQQIVIENGGGAGGVNGSKRVADARPDGYTIRAHDPPIGVGLAADHDHVDPLPREND
jgi:tripartite-type tricarboxylate transporter receptor subunit TctC